MVTSPDKILLTSLELNARGRTWAEQRGSEDKRD